VIHFEIPEAVPSAFVLLSCDQDVAPLSTGSETELLQIALRNWICGLRWQKAAARAPPANDGSDRGSLSEDDRQLPVRPLGRG